MRHLSRWVLGLSAILLGCDAPDGALNPLYLPGDVIADSSLVGEWHQDPDRYRIELVGERRLRIYVEDENDRFTASAFALELGGARFIDIFTDPTAGEVTPFLPVHVFFRYRTTPDSIVLSYVSEEDWLNRLADVGETMVVIQDRPPPELSVMPEGATDPESDAGTVQRILPQVTESLQRHVLWFLADTTVVWHKEVLRRVPSGTESSGGVGKALRWCDVSGPPSPAAALPRNSPEQTRSPFCAVSRGIGHNDSPLPRDTTI